MRSLRHGSRDWGPDVTTDTITRPNESMVDIEDPWHIGCRRHSPAVAFCGTATDPNEEWVTWRGQTACPLCVLTIQQNGWRSPCQPCAVLR